MSGVTCCLSAVLCNEDLGNNINNDNDIVVVYDHCDSFVENYDDDNN